MEEESTHMSKMPKFQQRSQTNLGMQKVVLPINAVNYDSKASNTDKRMYRKMENAPYFSPDIRANNESQGFFTERDNPLFMTMNHKAKVPPL